MREVREKRKKREKEKTRKERSVPEAGLEESYDVKSEMTFRYSEKFPIGEKRFFERVN